MKQTKEDFALARGALNMTTTQLAKALRMGIGSDRTIRRFVFIGYSLATVRVKMRHLKNS